MRLQTLMPSRETKNPHSVEDLENRVKGELLHSTVIAVSIPLQENLGYLQTPHPTEVNHRYLLINTLENVLIATCFIG